MCWLPSIRLHSEISSGLRLDSDADDSTESAVSDSGEAPEHARLL